MKDYANGEQTDGNEGSNNIMQHYKKLNRLGATVIVIHHSTPTYEKGKIVGIKLKGNSEGIRSNADITYLFERDFDRAERTVTAETSRVSSRESGSVMKYNAVNGWFPVKAELTQTVNSGSKDKEVNRGIGI